MNEVSYILPDVKRALVLSPHPDDETLGCGGTIAIYSEKIDFTVAAISNGEAVNIPEPEKDNLRQKELIQGMKILGIKNFVFLNFPDGEFSLYGDKIRVKIAELYASVKPQIVFSPSPFDPHQDHREIALCCIRLAAQFPLIRVAFYEVYGPLRFNVLIDIGQAIDIKKRALSRYHFSMLKKEDIFIEANLALNRSRSIIPLRDSFYEAFWIPMSSSDLFDFVQWDTYGAVPPKPEDRLLTKIKVADTLMSEIRNLERKIMDKNDIIDKLLCKTAEQEGAIAALEQRSEQIDRSLFWILARKFYGVRDALFPEEANSRRIYNKIIKKIKDKR